MAGGEASRPSVRLVPIAARDRAAIEALAVEPAQAHFVADNAASLAEADHDPGASPRAIMARDTFVGFLMYDASDRDDVRLYRFMIDFAQQGRGYGRAALKAFLDEIAALGDVSRISICYEPENEPARSLYAKAGFIEEGLDEDGEMIAALDLRGSGGS
ncbi:GNAT family N-acetyltransferase [Rhizobium sp. C1]|uniref:GNAT family N-acetyltransferase n=1 Tax=Rhizobium sp. C1 TaxID=1349799 RepID=UPI001E5B100B|nr:GNAT family protein [Rhizobium sp. C1]MCD2177982.1 GNAT family N-acetyltransferase [Rhizobium sp. C1]